MNVYDDDCDCPDEIINAAREPFLLTCEKCQIVTYFTLFNYDNIQLNMICEEEHSNHLKMDNCIRKMMNQIKKNPFIWNVIMNHYSFVNFAKNCFVKNVTHIILPLSIFSKNKF